MSSDHMEGASASSKQGIAQLSQWQGLQTPPGPNYFTDCSEWLRLEAPQGPSLPPLLGQGHLEQVAQGHVQVGCEELQGGRLHNLPDQLCHPHSKIAHPDVHRAPPALQFVPSASHPDTGHIRRAPGSPALSHTPQNPCRKPSLQLPRGCSTGRRGSEPRQPSTTQPQGTACTRTGAAGWVQGRAMGRPWGWGSPHEGAGGTQPAGGGGSW